MTGNRRVLFVTASVPLSLTEEAFVQDEVTSIQAAGCELLVAPMRRHLPRPNDFAVASGLANVTISAPLISVRILVGALLASVRSPRASTRVIARIIRQSGGRRNLANNLASLPKAMWLSRAARRENVVHIHAYWLSHTATAAWVASQLTGIPWSATGYRWDIDAANLFAAKLPSASFLRCVDELGRDGLEEATRQLSCDTPIHLIRSGVRIQDEPRWEVAPVHPQVVGCVGAFVEKKAQVLLVRAFRALYDRRPDARLHFFGEGPFEQRIRNEMKLQHLDGAVEFHGTVPLTDVRAFLAARPVTVLPSIITLDNQQEGIPVTLIEAMAHGSPVVSTRTGAIPSLVTAGCGILLEPGDVEGLSKALILLSERPTEAEQMSRQAFDRVRTEFDIARTSRALLDLIFCAA